MATPEFEFIPREEIAAQLTRPINYHKPVVAPADVTEGDLVLAMGNHKHYISTSLASDSKDEIATPVRKAVDYGFLGWRVVVPAVPGSVENAVNSLVGMSFGAEPNSSPHKLVQQAMDTGILDQQEVHPEASELFKAVGGSMVRDVRNSGDLLFSAIERRRKIEGSMEVHSSQLIYSRRLSAETPKLLERYRRSLREQGLEVPEWIYEATKLENRHRIAKLMAISGLATSLVKMPEETEAERKPRFWKRMRGIDF